MTNKEKKVAIFIDALFWYDGKCYTTNHPFVMKWVYFAQGFKEIILCVPVKYTTEYCGPLTLNNLENVTICSLPFYEKKTDLFKNSFFIVFKTLKIIFQNIKNWDIVWAVIPNLMGFVFSISAKLFSRPLCIFIRGNKKMNLKFECPSGIKGFLAVKIGRILEFATQMIIGTSNTLTFVAGDELYRQYKKKKNHVFKYSAVLIPQQDILSVERNLENFSKKGQERFNLLNVGRLSPEKGLDYLIDTANQLKKESQFPFIFNIVGDGPLETALKKKVEELKLEGYVNFKGYIPFGEVLIETYKKADIFVSSSSTEGVPSVVLEAMATGIPVIATSVGGLPNLIKDGENGLLVPPSSPEDMVKAILRLMKNEELRFKLIKNGLFTVKEYTLENQRDRIVSIIELYFNLSNFHY